MPGRQNSSDAAQMALCLRMNMQIQLHFLCRVSTTLMRINLHIDAPAAPCLRMCGSWDWATSAAVSLNVVKMNED